MTELENLVHKLASLFDLLASGQTVPESELERTAKQVYQYARMPAGNPLTDLQLDALVKLSAAPLHPTLDVWRARAEGALDMYNSLFSPLPGAQPAVPSSPKPKKPFVAPARRQVLRSAQAVPDASAPQAYEQEQGNKENSAPRRLADLVSPPEDLV